MLKKAAQSDFFKYNAEKLCKESGLEYPDEMWDGDDLKPEFGIIIFHWLLISDVISNFELTKNPRLEEFKEYIKDVKKANIFVDFILTYAIHGGKHQFLEDMPDFEDSFVA